ncbi:hypothetical protein MUG87_14445 [Ectobacillus sp. JY-23]|uniref:hypothetical protein n=1 Tax=Ectobacillus sp. JY-23 TaxID=2933872 RepID=UPI001FF5A01E|nr:hypothetical protein [Ectobacillus sp. JY-23]UOY91682.1 hypothetical protein MUG87_14445 [Ectobacillus sp. JY-23]
MSFQPQVDEQITLFGRTYKIAKHPAVVGIDIPYGQEGRQGIVYQLYTDSDKAALKVFRSRFRDGRTEGDTRYQYFPGLTVSERLKITKQNHKHLIETYEDLKQAVLMPWIEGPTWADILLEEQPLTQEESGVLAASLAYLLYMLEEQGRAHCDLSASNLILSHLAEQSTYPIELVDIEQMYDKNLEKPAVIPGGTKGYAPTYIKDGIWTAHGDRFAGAVLLAEMLGWVEEAVRFAKANDASYFDETDMHGEGERYQTLVASLRKHWGENIGHLFETAWKSNSLEECPSFRMWWEALPEEIKEESKRKYNKCLMEAKARLPEHKATLSAQERLEAARLLEQVGNKEAALREYQYMSTHMQYSSLWEDLKGLVNEKEVSSSFQLTDYIEAASIYEKNADWKSAIFLYDYAQKQFATDETVVQELSIISAQLQETQKLEEKAVKIEELEIAKQKIEAPFYIEREKKTSPFAATETKEPFRYKKWMIGAGASIGITLLLAASYYGITEYRYKSNIEAGKKAYNEMEYLEAEERFEKAAAIKETEDAYVKLAATYVMREQYQKTIEYLADLKAKGKISKRSALGAYFTGRAWFSLKNYDQAVISYKAALASKDGKLGDYRNPALRDLAVSYAQQGKSEEARNVLASIEQTDDRAAAFVNWIEGDLASVDKNYTYAIEKYKTASEKDPDTLRYKQLLGRAYVLANRTETDFAKKEAQFKTAIDILSSVRSADPNNAIVLGDLASAYSEAGGFYEVQSQLDKSAGMYNEAIKLYETIRQTGFSNDNLDLNIAALNGKLDRVDEAQAGFQRVLERKPNDGHAFMLYGLFLMDQKKYKEAFDALDKAEQFSNDAAERDLAKNRKQELKDKGFVK